MIAAWVITAEKGVTVAAGTIRGPTPLNAFEAYTLAASVAHAVELALLNYLPDRHELDDDTLPLPWPMAAE